MIVDSIPAGIALLSPAGAVEIVNDQLVRYFGKPLEQLKDWAAGDIIHPDDLPRVVDAFTHSIATGDAFDNEQRLRRFDGTYRWIQVRWAPLRDADGRTVGWCTLHTDIDERKRAEEALRQSERRLQSVIDGIPGFVAILAADGNLEVVNRQIVEYCGRPLEELRSWGTNGTVHPEDLPHVVDIFTRSIAGGVPYAIEQRVRRHDGAYRWFNNRGIPVRDDSGRIARWYVLLTDIDERKRAEQALRASEINLRKIIETIPALAWAARPDGTGEFFNQHYLDYVGLSREQLRDWGWTAAVHPDDLDALIASWRAIMAAGREAQGEVRLRRRDGEYRWFLFRVSPLRDAHGDIVNWYGVNTDIEDRKRAETHLAGEKRLLEMIASGRPLQDVLVAICGFFEQACPDCRCGVYPIDWNGPIFQYGIAPSLPGSYIDPIEGLAVGCDVAPCGIAAHQKIPVIVEDMETDPRWKGTSYQDHVLRHGLRAVWSTPICSPEGRVLGTFCIYQRKPGIPSTHHQDLIAYATHIASIAIERAQAEDALRRSEMLLAEGQRLSATGTYSWRVETDQLTFSEELRRTFEFDRDVAVTVERIRERVHPEDHPLLVQKMERARAGHENPEYELRLRMPDGRLKHLRVLGRLIRHEDGRLECLGAVQDVTRRRLAEEARDSARSELSHVTRVMSLGALTASIAHEVNQPLAGIMTNASTCLRMLAADPPNIEGARETARRTIRDGNRAGDVIARLRALFGKKAAVSETLDLNEATRGVLALLFSDILRNRVVLRVELGDEPLLVTGDRVQLQQVILNLVRNALDAMRDVNDRPRDLLVRADTAEGRARLVVKDAGVGFAPQDAERLFDAFYTTKSDGMGIGLSLSRSIIESHGGMLWAEPNQGPGATFAFFIPGLSDSVTADRIGGAGSSTVTGEPDVMRSE
jgi:PAS domain S-box-containing protein